MKNTYENYKQTIKGIPFLGPLLSTIKKQTGNKAPSGGEFKRRIQHRSQTFWNDPEADAVRNTPMQASDPMSKWKDVNHWQRRLSNKSNSREFATAHGCKISDLYWKGKDFSQVDFSALPAAYVIRPTIGRSSKMVFLMKNGINLMDNKPYAKEGILRLLEAAVVKHPYPDFFFEEFLQTEGGEHKILNDYKIHAFNGEIAAIQLINRLSPKTGYSTWYDEHWNLMDNLETYYPKGAVEPPPKCLDEMMAKTKALSKSYEIFVRIDFFATPKGAVFCEFAATPGGGRDYTPAGEALLIEYWDKYCNGKI